MCRACAEDPVAALVCRERAPEYLRLLYLFQDLSEEDLAEVVEASRAFDLADGQWLYREGESADRFFVVLEGELALFRQSIEGKESVVALVGSDELFCEELVCRDDAVYDLNARAIGHCHLLSLDREHFRSLVLRSPEVGLRLLATQHRRQLMLLDHIERLTLQDGTQRLVNYLLNQVGTDVESQRVRLRVPKHTLAAHLSMQPETLSRILARLKSHNHIEEDGDELIVKARDLRSSLDCTHCRRQFWGCPGPENIARWFREHGVSQQPTAASLG